MNKQFQENAGLRHLKFEGVLMLSRREGVT